jgi:hypothetical protein
MATSVSWSECRRKEGHAPATGGGRKLPRFSDCGPEAKIVAESAGKRVGQDRSPSSKENFCVRLFLAAFAALAGAENLTADERAVAASRA